MKVLFNSLPGKRLIIVERELGDEQLFGLLMIPEAQADLDLSAEVELADTVAPLISRERIDLLFFLSR